MSDKITLSPEAQETLRALRTMPARMLQDIARAMDTENQLAISRIVADYLSFPKDAPAVPIGLRTQSGLGRRSVRASEAEIKDQTVRSSLGTNLDYMIAHELGAVIPAHRVFARDAKALRFQIGQRIIFAKHVDIPAVTLPARMPIQRGIADHSENYAAAFSNAITSTWEQRQ